MRPIKRVEIILPEGESADVLEALEALEVSGYTLIPSVSGRGDRGATVHGFGHLDNSYLMIACEPHQVESVVEVIRPFLRRFGGVCLVSDAQWVIH
jgi:nitrogen regulatory protein PII